MTTPITPGYEEIKSCRRLHFIGIGGVSMSSLAAMSHNHGYIVSGSDVNESLVIMRLRDMGITIYPTHDATNVEQAQAIIYTAAVSEDNAEMAEARRRGLPCISRAQYLGGIMRDYTHRIGVSGTHGKSSTTSMLSSIFINAKDFDPTIFCGAETKGLDGAYRIGGRQHFIYESDEYKDSFLQFSPTLAIILNVDFDHVDYFSGTNELVRSFTKAIEDADIVVANWDDEDVRRATANYGGKLVKVSAKSPEENPEADYYATDIAFSRGLGAFSLTCNGEEIGRTQLAVPGLYNVYNALCAATAAHLSGVPAEEIMTGLQVFGGTKRRFEFKGSYNDIDVFDDYAHHHTEMAAALEGAKNRGYNRVHCIFQPHTYSRTKNFAAQMAEALAIADHVIVTDIYAARETPIPGVTAEDIASRVKGAVHISEFAQIASHIRATVKPGDMVLTMGAGDVHKIGDLLL